MGFARCGHLYQALPEFSRCRDPREDNNAHAICPRIYARPRTGRKRRPAGHNIIHQEHLPSGQSLSHAWVWPDRIGQKGHPFCPAATFQHGCF